jgi:polar amino acid transport system substrate-binding protein
MATQASCIWLWCTVVWILSFSLHSPLAHAAEKPVLRWCMDHFPGMHEFNGSSRMPVGPSVEMMQELARLAGFTLKMGTRTPTSRCLKQLADGETDIMVNLLHSNERAQTINLIRFASRHPDRLYLAQTNPIQVTELNQLQRLSLVSVRNFGLHPTIQAVVDTLPPEQKQPVDSILIALQMVAKGRAEGTLLPPAMVQLLLSQHPELVEHIREVNFVRNKIQPQDIYLGLSRHVSDPTLPLRIHSAVQQMKKNGTMRRLLGDKVLD